MDTTIIRKPKLLPSRFKRLGNRREELNEFIGFMLFFYLVPVLLLYLRLLPFGSHNVIIPLMGLLIAAYVMEKEVGAKRLGFRKDNLKESLVWGVIFSLLLVLLMISLTKSGFLNAEGYGKEKNIFYVYYVLISAPIQEFIFRSVMSYEFDLFLGKGKIFLKVLLTAFVFALAHSFYHSWVVLGGTFVIGLFWGFLYSKHKNFWALALSHGIIGAAAIFIGLV